MRKKGEKAGVRVLPVLPDAAVQGDREADGDPRREAGFFSPDHPEAAETGRKHPEAV